MIPTFIPNLLNDVWVDSHNRLIGVFYVSNDQMGLFAVPNQSQVFYIITPRISSHGHLRHLNFKRS